MLPDQQADVRQLLDLLIWDNHERVDAALALVLTDEHADLPLALRLALGDYAPTADWNQLDFLLASIKDLALARDIGGDIHDADEDNFDLDEPDAFFAALQMLLVDYGYDVWSWETGDDTFCALIARTEDRERIDVLARRLGLTADNNAALTCCAYY